MDENEFWAIIQQSLDVSGGDVNRQAHALDDLLRDRSASDLEAFGGYLETAEARLYRWDCWEAGSLISGGMSDDSFMDFRVWIISRGREVYEQTLADPDSLAELPEVQHGEEEFAAEDFGGVVYATYKERHGEELYPDAEFQPDPAGDELDHDAIARLLPRLTALRGG